MGPHIRAALPLQSLRVLELVAGGEYARVLGCMRPGSLRRIRGAGSLDWLPLELDLELVEAVADVLGPEVDRERARLCVRACFDTPLLRPFVAGIELLFGLEPAALIGAVPRAWHVLYRDAGRIHYEIVPGLQRVLIYEQIPASVLTNHLYLEAIAGALESLFDVCKVDGSVELAEVDEHRGRAELHCYWH